MIPRWIHVPWFLASLIVLAGGGVLGDVEVAGGYLCGLHLDQAYDEAAALRTEFDALIAAGVSRDEANRLMIEKIEGRQARS